MSQELDNDISLVLSNNERVKFSQKNIKFLGSFAYKKSFKKI